MMQLHFMQFTVYSMVSSFCEQICSEEPDTLFVNFEVFHSVHFHILDASGHLVGVSEETSFCEVQLNYNAEAHFMVFTLYSTSLLSVHAEV